MTTTEETRQVVFKYFHSWQKPSDYRAFRDALADDVVFDAGGDARITGADALTANVRATEAPWTTVTLLASMFQGDQAALFYEGVDERTEHRTRVAEHLKIHHGRITHILATIRPVDEP
jgi:hypothetical protein